MHQRNGRIGERICSRGKSKSGLARYGHAGEMGAHPKILCLCLCPRTAARSDAWPQEAAIVGPVSSCLGRSLGAGWARGRTSNLLVRSHVMLRFGNLEARMAGKSRILRFLQQRNEATKQTMKTLSMLGFL